MAAWNVQNILSLKIFVCCLKPAKQLIEFVGAWNLQTFWNSWLSEWVKHFELKSNSWQPETGKAFWTQSRFCCLKPAKHFVREAILGCLKTPFELKVILSCLWTVICYLYHTSFIIQNEVTTNGTITKLLILQNVVQITQQIFWKCVIINRSCWHHSNTWQQNFQMFCPFVQHHDHFTIQSLACAIIGPCTGWLYFRFCEVEENMSFQWSRYFQQKLLFNKINWCSAKLCLSIDVNIG